MSSEDYEPSLLALIFHGAFPRWDLTFVEVNNTFAYEDTNYRESLIIWAAVPVLWLVLTLLVFLMYFCYRCCQRDIEKKQRVPCLRWTMTILALLTCAIIGVGYYGNEQLYKGISKFAASFDDANNTMDRMKKEVDALQEVINDTVDSGIDGMQQIYQTHPTLQDDTRSNLERLSSKCTASARTVLHTARYIRDKAATRISLDSQNQFNTATIGFWLWIGIIILLSCFILLCLNLLLGIGRSSKCILLLFCALGIIFLVVCWISAGIFLGSSLGVSDFCVSPDAHMQKMAGLMSKDEKDVLRYYIMCDSKPSSNPFRNAFQEAQVNVRSVNNTLNRALDIAYKENLKQQLKPYVLQVKQGIDMMVETLLHLTALVECTSLNKDYSDAIEGICYTSLPGIVFLLMSTTLTGIMLTILVLMASRAWRHFSRRKGYQEVEEDDPFLPRPDPNSPSYYSFTRQGPRGNPRTAGEQITMQRRNTPPPAMPTGGGGSRRRDDDEDDDGEDYYNIHRARGPLSIPPSEQQTLPLHTSIAPGDMLPPYSTTPRYT